MTAPKSKFLKVACSKCKNEQIIFDKSNKPVKCLVCENMLTENKRGRCSVTSKVIQSMD